MKMLIIISLLYFISEVTCDYDNKRCICICPDPSIVNGTKTERKIYKAAVPPSKCDCTNVVLPNVGPDVRGHEQEFCPRCECRYESRNTATIKVVVIIVMWILAILVIYMAFLLCLDPMLNKKRGSVLTYREHLDDEDDASIDSHGSGMSQPLRVRPNVIGRVTHQQDKWKRQVEEQRRNIYDRHTMLN